MNAAAASLLGGVRIDPATKGFPPLDRPIRLDDVAARGWRLEDLQPPVLVLRDAAVEHNLALMTAYCRDRRVEIAPHGKTTMAPQLWWRQLDAGAWGITAATAVQARTMRAAGVRRILVANELTDPASIAWAAADLADEDAELLCYVDSEGGIALLEGGLRSAGAGRPLGVLIELGHLDGRTGCRDPEEAAALARRVAGSPLLRLAGVAGYEGTIAHDRGHEALDRVRTFLGSLRRLAERLLADDVLSGPAVVTAGGSVYFDLVAERLSGGWPDGADVTVVLRSGCYLTHDAGVYERSSPFAALPPAERFRSALEAWGAVWSRPEPGFALLGLGRRDVPWDQGLPTPMRVRRRDGSEDDLGKMARIEDLNDQHAFCRLEDGLDLRVGDLVMCGISHPCTAFDRWRVIPVLDDDDRVVDAVATFF